MGFMVLRGPYHIYMYIGIHMQYFCCVLLAKTAVGIAGPEHASEYYCNASKNFSLLKSLFPILCQDLNKAYLHLTT